jgi:hypothetical protein
LKDVEVIIFVQTKLGHEKKVAEKQDHTYSGPRNQRRFDACFRYH